MDERSIEPFAGTALADGVVLDGVLTVPPGARGIVVFARGRRDSRIPGVATVFQRHGLATMMLDLSTREVGKHDGWSTVDPGVLAARLVAAIDSIVAQHVHRDLRIGVFADGEAAAVTAMVAARRPEHIAAIVCCGGHEIAPQELVQLRVPTMLIAGSRDTSGLRGHRDASRVMVRAPVVVVISGAGRQFDQPGALDEVAAAAGQWLLDRLAAPAVV